MDGQIAGVEARLAREPETETAPAQSAPNPAYLTAAQGVAQARSDLRSVEARIPVVAAALGRAQNAQTQLPAKISRLSFLGGNLATLQSTYDALNAKVQTLQLSAASQLANGSVTSPATIPGAPSGPSRVRTLLMAAVLGALLAYVAALLVDRLDEKIHDQSEVARTTQLPILIDGLAMGAEALHRGRSRSRSRSPSKRKYYSKRVSPRHSYVDLSATTSTQAGLAGFFSPSSNKKKGKKPKGLFNFGNASSSSSDADLVFGEGTVKRKPSKKGKGKENDTNYGSTAAILGLAATGVALAAESDRRESKGKQGRHANESAGRDPRRSSSGKIKLQDHESTTDGQNDDAWEDASDASSSSVDTGLAYGGRASAAQSRESLPGTDKWDWRWGPNKEKRRGKLRRQSSDNLNAAETGLVGAGTGATTAEMMSTDSTPKPPLRHLDPVPTSDPTLFDARQSSAISGISPFSSVAPPEHFVTSSSVPLQQPQPVFPVAAVPDKFGRLENEVRYSDNPRVMEGGRDSQRELDRKARSRRDSSPAKLPSRESRGTVSFDVPDATEQSQRQEREEDSSRRSRREDKERRKSASSATPSKNNEDADPKLRRRSSEYDRREAEIEAELQRLYEEDRKRKERQRKQDNRDRKVEVAGVAAVAAAVGAGIAAGAASKGGKRSSSSEDTTPRRKSIMKKGKEREASPQGDTQQERIARMAAQRVRSTASPVHEDYQTFFVPTEIAEHVKEHNEESAHRRRSRSARR